MGGIPEGLLQIFTFVFGSLIGSFLNVCIYRIPEEESIVLPASHCLNCGHRIRVYDNIPVISFLILKGRCRDCGEPLSWQYPFIEIFTGLLALACLLKFGTLPLALLWFLTFLCPLLVVSVIDLRHFLIPDVISIPFIVVGVGVHWLASRPAPTGAILLDSLFGILLGGGALFCLGKLYEWLLAREGMGMGDVKLAAMIGAFLGWKAMIIIFVLSSLAGSIVGIILMIFSRHHLRSPIPYGPFLSLAAAVYLFFGRDILRAYFLWVQGFFNS